MCPEERHFGQMEDIFQTRTQIFQSFKSGISNTVAFGIVYDAYRIRLRSVKPWESIKGTPGLRRGGSAESITVRKRKTGPKSKSSARTVKAIFQFADRHSTDTNQEIADFTNLRVLVLYGS